MNWVRNKFLKTSKRKGFIFAISYIPFYVFRRLINKFIMLFLNNSNFNGEQILFIEPVNQGYGDLFFQTSLFKTLKKTGHKISILTNKKRSQILENNEDLEEVCFWNLKGVKKIFSKKYIVVGLGRSTFIETLILFLSENRIILDKNIKNWLKIFKNNPNTIAWIKLFEKLLSINLDKTLPKICFSSLELKWIKNNKSNYKAGVVYGVSDKTKKFIGIDSLIEKIPTKYKISLLGIKSGYLGKINVVNLTNKTYRETILEIATCSHIVGTEGSLVHIASSLGINLFVIDEKNEFIKNCHPELLHNVQIFDKGDIVEDLANKF